MRIDVRDHGAVGDGVTDDRAALQAAINAVGAGGGEVCVPAGSYKVTSSLALRSGARIVGSGRGRSRILAAPGISTAVLLGTSGAAVVDVDIVDLCIDGAWGSVTVALAGMQVTNGSRITVERCDLQNLGGPGVLLQGLSGASGTPDSIVRDNRITSCGQADGSTGHAITVKDSSPRALVTGNLIKGNRGGMGVAFFGTAGTGYPTHGSVTSNIIDQAASSIGFEAIGLGTGCEWAVVSDNNITDSQDNGISVTPANCAIVGNVITGTLNHGIASGGQNNTIIGNVVRNIGRDNLAQYGGIMLDTTGRNVVVGNSVYDDQGTSTTYYGIKIYASTGGHLIALNRLAGYSGAAYSTYAADDIVLDATARTNGLSAKYFYTDNLRVATTGQSLVLGDTARAQSQFYVGSGGNGSGQLNVQPNLTTRAALQLTSPASQTADLLQALSSASSVIAGITAAGRVYGAGGVTTVDLGDITGKTSAQLDALFAAAPPDGTVAVGLASGSQVMLSRRGGKWNSVPLSMIS